MKKLLVIGLAISMFAVGCTNDKKTDNNFNDKDNMVDSVDTDDKEDVNKTDEETNEVYEQIKKYLWEEAEKAFSPYYELLDYDISLYEEYETEEGYEVFLNYKIIHKNFDKDPDTVDYIKRAKESGDKNYQTLYDEYLAPKDMNMYLKIKIDKEGKITLFTDVDPTSNSQWEEVVMQDFILDN